MAILNYTTKVPASRTISTVQDALAKHGAQSVSIEYANGQPEALTFSIRISPGQPPVSFRLPCNHAGVWAAMRDDATIPKSLKTPEQAFRVGWRIVKDWLEAQLALVEAGLAVLPEVMLPYAVTPAGTTLYQHLLSDPAAQRLLLEAADAD